MRKPWTRNAKPEARSPKRPVNEKDSGLPMPPRRARERAAPRSPAGARRRTWVAAKHRKSSRHAPPPPLAAARAAGKAAGCAAQRGARGDGERTVRAEQQAHG